LFHPLVVDANPLHSPDNFHGAPPPYDW